MMFMEWFSIALAGGCLIAIAFLALRGALGKKKASVSLVTPVPLRVSLGCLVLIGGAVGVYALSQSGNEPPPAKSSAYQVEKDASANWARIDNSALEIGKPAPGFDLTAIKTAEKVPLWKSAGSKPVVLIFGNFGCSYFCTRLDLIKNLQETYQDRAEFRLVYIDIEHDEPPAMRAVLADPALPASDIKNRVARVRAGMEQFGLAMDCVIDEDDNRAQNSYRAFPARLVIVDAKGELGFDSGNIFQNGLDIAGAVKWLDEHSPQAHHRSATGSGQHSAD